MKNTHPAEKYPYLFFHGFWALLGYGVAVTFSLFIQ